MERFFQEQREAENQLTDGSWILEVLHKTSWGNLAEYLLSESALVPSPPDRPGFAGYNPDELQHLKKLHQRLIRRIVILWREKGVL